MKERKSYEMALKKAADKLSAAEKKTNVSWRLLLAVFCSVVIILMLLW